MGSLSFAELLELLGHADHTGIASRSPQGRFESRVLPTAQAAQLPLDPGRDWWFGINPLPAGITEGRGSAGDVTRLACLYADLDVKPGGLSSFEAAQSIVDDLSEMLNTRPMAITLSGHGLQPLWPIDVDETTAGQDATALLRRFGRLVREVAVRRDGPAAGVDSVFDLARILRIPGTYNLKDPAAPLPVLTISDTGHYLTLEEIDDALNAYGAVEQAGDRQQLRDEVVATPTDWHYRTEGGACAYARTAVQAWTTDPPKSAGRHPWLLSQATRLAAMHRNGCLTQAAHAEATRALADRFRAFCIGGLGGPPRDPTPGEISDALDWGVALVARLSVAEMSNELGNHSHGDEELDPEFPFGRMPGGPSAPPPVPSPATSQRAPDSGASGDQDVTATERYDVAKTLASSEDGLAQLVIYAHGSRIRYCSDRKGWLMWTGSKWEWQPGEDGAGVRELVKQVARGLPAASTPEIAFKRRALSASGTSAALQQMRTDPRIAIRASEIDADPYALNTPTGYVDLRTGQFHAPDPGRLYSRSTNYSPAERYDPALAPRWERFLADTFAGDAALCTYVQRLLGYSLIGTPSEQIMPFLHGSGANGKSTLVGLIQRIVGLGEGGYSITVPASIFLAGHKESHPAEIAQLSGARLVISSELEDGERFAESKVKSLTGGDALNARFMYGNPFSFTPTHTPLMLANSRPDVRSGGESIWRRLRLIPFEHTVPREQRDPHLEEKLLQEAEQVLAWLIQGALDYCTQGLVQPESVKLATEAYAAEQDTVSAFVAECCDLGPVNAQTYSLPFSELHQSYEAWCRETGASPVAKRLFTPALAKHGVAATRSNGTRMLSGIRIKLESAEAPRQEQTGLF